MLDSMHPPGPEWVTIAAYEDHPGGPSPGAAVRAWLRDRGIDWMPFQDNDLRIDIVCGPGPGGDWRGTFLIYVRPRALRALGLHPDQPSAAALGPSPPDWWHEEAERAADHHPWPTA